MTRARMPRPHEVAAARRDPRLLRAVHERGSDQSWRTRGLCRSVDPETFFPAPSEPADAAVALCRTCPVQGSCLAWALDVGDCHGVWGATTPRERRAMLVAWRAQTPPADVDPELPVLAPVGPEPVGPAPVASPALLPAAAGVRAPASALAPAAMTPLGPPVRPAVAEPARSTFSPAASIGLCAVAPTPLPLGMPRRRFEPDDELIAWNHLVEQVPV